MEPTNQAVLATPQAPSVMPTAAVADSASQYATSQPSTYQGSPQMAPQAWANQAPQAYPQVQAPQASAQAPSANPWQEAFQALSASLNTPQVSPIQAPSYQQATPTPQINTQAQWGSVAQQAPQISTPQASTQAYLGQMQAPSQQQMQVMQQAASQQVGSASARDSYLSQISDQSLEVLEHFGAEAPALLNQYACALDAAGEERAAMNIMLTDPDVLADYVNDFYGPNGPYPVPSDQEVAQRNEIAQRLQFESEIAAQEQNQVPPNFQRPQMDMPERGVNQNPAQSFWGDFSQMMDSNPENAWQYLAQAPQGALQAKMLIQDL